MIQYSLQQLHGVNVQTRSGNVLGTLKDLVIDAEILQLTAIVVRPHGLVKSLIAGDLIIPMEKVIKISLEGVIVEDASIAEQAMQKNMAVKIPTGNDAVLSMDIDQN